MSFNPKYIRHLVRMTLSGKPNTRAECCVRTKKATHLFEVDEDLADLLCLCVELHHFRELGRSEPLTDPAKYFRRFRRPCHGSPVVVAEVETQRKLRRKMLGLPCQVAEMLTTNALGSCTILVDVNLFNEGGNGERGRGGRGIRAANVGVFTLRALFNPQLNPGVMPTYTPWSGTQHQQLTLSVRGL